MLDRYTRKLFTSAAAFNWAAVALIGGATLCANGMELLGLTPVSGSGKLYLHITIGAIALFGWAYWQVSRDPVRNRPFAQLGLIGKLVTVALVWGNWAAGNIGWPLAALVIGDVIYAWLFWRWLSSCR